MTLWLLIGHKNRQIERSMSVCYSRGAVIPLKILIFTTKIQYDDEHLKHVKSDVHLQEHVSRFNSAISSYSSSLHDRADVNAAIPPVVALANNTDT